MSLDMIVEMDYRVQKVAEFMTKNLLADELVAVAKALNLVAPSLWGRYPESEIYPLSLGGSLSLLNGAHNETPLDLT